MDAFRSLIGKCPNFEALLRNARMVASTDVTVLIVGETGTGKEVLAQALQCHSPRADSPFITVNCAALPEGLVESELFGHRKGAFTGANQNQTGKFQAAHHGTIFLDEVDSLPLHLQAKLLRVLESGECQPVGETRHEMVDTRVIAASNANLPQKIAEGTFRKDLYYRLNVVPLELPPLRERRADIELLLTHYMQAFAAEHGLALSRFSKSALQKLRDYHWPGNIRELRNLCERLAILLQGRLIDAENLPWEVEAIPTTGYSATNGGFALPDCGIRLEEVEKDLIRQALVRTRGNRSQSARLLGLTRDTLIYRMQKYEIN